MEFMAFNHWYRGTLSLRAAAGPSRRQLSDYGGGWNQTTNKPFYTYY